MCDYLERELNIGDDVLLIEPGYRNYKVGTIKRFTKMYCIVEYKTDYGSINTIKQKGRQLIKIEI